MKPTPKTTRPSPRKSPIAEALLARIAGTISRHRLVKRGDRVLVGLSGGPDSVALLTVLLELSKVLRISLSAVYVNHQIRPKAALAEEKFCQKLCEWLDVPFFIERQNVPLLAVKKKIGLEEAGREVRYAVFDRLCRAHGFTKVALAHHRDDNVETVLFRILRGTGLSGLRGIPVSRGKIIRPLLETPKTEILAWLKGNRLSFCIDKSNLKSSFSRNSIRNFVLPLLRSKMNPSVDDAILRLAASADETEAFCAKSVLAAAKRVVKISPGGKFILDLKKWERYDSFIRRRVLRHCLTELSPHRHPPDRKVVDRLHLFVTGLTIRCSLPERVSCEKVGYCVYIFRRLGVAKEIVLPVPSSTRIEDFSLVATVRVKKAAKAKHARRSLSVTLDADKIEGALTMRAVRDGDRFAPLGMTGTKKIGDYFTDRKVDRPLRDETPVVTDSRGIVWLVGFEIADRVKCDAATRKVVEIAVRRRTQDSPSAL